jgi:hypothetical protein
MAALRRTRRLITATALALVCGATSLTHAAAPPDTTTPPGTTTPPDTSIPADETSPGEAGAFAVQPSSEKGPGGRDYFIYTLPQGQQFGDRVAISNLSDTAATFAVYATDAVNTDDGSFSLLREDEDPQDVGAWVELGATQYTVEPGEQVIIPFSISVPADASPGDHVGAIVAQKLDDPNSTEGGIGADVRVRIGARIYVRVDGPVSPSLSIESFGITYDAPGTPFSGHTAKITYVVTNTGDIRLSPTADLKLAGLFGLGEQQLEQRQIPELLPGGSITIAEVAKDVKPLGRLTADLSVRATDESVVADASITQWAVPWLSLGVLGLVVVALVVWRIVARRRRVAGT